MRDNQSINQSMYQKDPNFTKYRLCFKNSLRDLDQLLKEISSKPSTLSNANNLTLIHGYLLIILEIVKFAGLEFEQQLEQYLSKYNLYHQNKQGTNKNVRGNQTVGSSQMTNNANSSLIENTARSCEEMHASNLLKLLPHSCFDPTHANDPFMFLFKSEKISVNIKSQTCEQMISMKWLFSVIL